MTICKLSVLICFHSDIFHESGATTTDSAAWPKQDPEEQREDEPHTLLALTHDCLVAALRQCTIPSILRFSECSKAAHHVSSDTSIWRPLFQARRWAGSQVGGRAGAWKACGAGGLGAGSWAQGL